MNPYQPPHATTLASAAGTSPRFLASLTPAALATGLTLLVWVALVSTLDGVFPQRFMMPFWSFTLLLATSLSILVVSRAWRTATHPFAFAGVFSVFSLVFLITEGDTSNGADYRNMTITYATLLFLPIFAYTLARCMGHKRHDVLHVPDGG